MARDASGREVRRCSEAGSRAWRWPGRSSWGSPSHRCWPIRRRRQRRHLPGVRWLGRWRLQCQRRRDDRHDQRRVRGPCRHRLLPRPGHHLQEEQQDHSGIILNDIFGESSRRRRQDRQGAQHSVRVGDHRCAARAVQQLYGLRRDHPGHCLGHARPDRHDQGDDDEESQRDDLPRRLQGNVHRSARLPGRPAAACRSGARSIRPSSGRSRTTSRPTSSPRQHTTDPSAPRLRPGTRRRPPTLSGTLRAGSSAAEHGTFNPLVVGSNPTRLAEMPWAGRRRHQEFVTRSR